MTLSPTKAAIAVGVGAIFAVAGWVWGPEPDVQRVAGVLLAFALAWGAMVDIDRYILPNVVTLGLVVAGLGLAAAEGWSRLLDCAIGAVAAYASLWLVAWLFQTLRGKEGLGAGDWKLFAAAGAWVGWMHLPQVMLFASVAALVGVGGLRLLFRKREHKPHHAFGPFLAVGFWLVWVSDGAVWLVGSA